MATINIEEAKRNVEQVGFLDVDIDSRIDLFEEIRQLKK